MAVFDDIFLWQTLTFSDNDYQTIYNHTLT